jgi:hypothetical protein
VLRSFADADSVGVRADFSHLFGAQKKLKFVLTEFKSCGIVLSIFKLLEGASVALRLAL